MSSRNQESGIRNREYIPPDPPRGGRGDFLLFLLLSPFLVAGCISKTPGGRVADDQDITRDILWEIRKDPRLGAVRVSCVDRTVTLEGTVPDRAALDEALRIAALKAGGARLLSSLVIRPR